MRVLFYSENDERRIIENRLRRALPEATVDVHPEAGNRAQIDYAVVWQPPTDFFAELNGLKAVFSLGAGVDHLLQHPGLPDIPIVRLQDAGMGEKMAEYVLYGVLHAQRKMSDYAVHQKAENWAHDAGSYHAHDCQVGILGLGMLGQIVADRLRLNNYPVAGWSRSAKQIDHIECYTGDQGLQMLLAKSDVIVCLLPLTPATQGLLNRDLFAQMKPGAFVINLARGGHVVASDLIAALDSGHLAGALLDVTDPEPLPVGDPLWQHERVVLTPHVAGPTQEGETIDQVAANIRRHAAGESMQGVVDRVTGY